MPMFTLSTCLTTSSLPWFMGLISGSNATLLFTASDFTSVTSHVHNCVLFLLWLRLFILSGVISSLISNSILGTYQSGEFFQCPIFFPFHTVHWVLQARILKWFAITFSSGPLFVRTLHHDLSILGGPTQHSSQFHWVRQVCGPCDQIGWFSVIVVSTGLATFKYAVQHY